MVEYKLCYVRDNIMYFTDDFENVHGDDFNDAPYECNAGTPYSWSKYLTDEENKEYGHTHLRYLGFYSEDVWIKEPCDYGYNSYFSVEDINKGAVAWLYCEEAGGLMAGATIEEAIEWCKKANVKCGELK